ncbi:hypothetical protein GGR52DRAFT_567719 [Hypoxylon sp. FL1284]|nr:hypothetical protein GGR52DRAFT_567719 [Hypoxylon sp. FL1284]
MSGQFGFMAKIGASDAAVATLNDQPYIFTILVVVLVAVILQIVFLWYIHHATLKPEQKKKKEPKGKKAGGKPPAARGAMGGFFVKMGFNNCVAAATYNAPTTRKPQAHRPTEPNIETPRQQDKDRAS